MLEAMKLSAVANALSGRLSAADASFTGVSIDSRSIQPGQLFVALTGPRFDGHDYLDDVAAKGLSRRWWNVKSPTASCRNWWCAIPAWPWGNWGR